jgi:hypothetical protein
MGSSRSIAHAAQTTKSRDIESLIALGPSLLESETPLHQQRVGHVTEIVLQILHTLADVNPPGEFHFDKVEKTLRR